VATISGKFIFDAKLIKWVDSSVRKSVKARCENKLQGHKLCILVQELLIATKTSKAFRIQRMRNDIVNVT